MRETKFRGKDIETGEWREGSLVRRKDGRCYIILLDGIIGAVTGSLVTSDVFEIDPDTVSEYTGRKDDKNDKKIWEGDIILYSLSQTQHRKGVVYYEGCSWLIDCRWEKNDPIGDICTGGEYRHSKGVKVERLADALYDVEVIGNIHDTLELLEDKK